MTDLVNPATPARYLQGRGPLLLSGLAVILLIFSFHRGILFLFDRWTVAEYSHAWIIPPLAALIAIDRLNRAPVAPGGNVLGIPLVVFGYILLLVGELAGMYLIVSYGLLFAAVGMTWTAVGTAGIWRIRAALLYLLFALPIPDSLYSSLSLQMQLWSSEFGVFLMRLVGVSVFLQGNMIDLGAFKLEVEEACNGLRYLFPLVSFGFLAAILMQDRFWKRAVLLVSTLPITVVVNSLRIAMIGVLVDNYGIEMAQGAHHLIEGFVIFAICVVILLAEVWILLRIGTRGTFAPFDLLSPDLNRLSAVMARHKTNIVRTTVGVVAAATIAVVVVAPQSNEERAPDRLSLDLFPMRIDDWAGRANELESVYVNILRMTEYLLADYRSAEQAAGVNLFVAYYDSQRAGIAPHSPQHCIPGDGWEIVSFDNREMPQGVVEAGGPTTVNRALITRHGIDQVVYYWFDQRGRQLTSAHALKFFVLWDVLSRGRSDGALVRLISPIRPGETADDAEGRLIAFMEDTVPAFPQYLPH